MLSFEQLAAIVGKTAEKTRLDGSQIGNGLKTIMTRLSKVGELSDEVDPETLSDASESLHKIGIEVYNADGSFRKFDVIMGELANKWDTLSDAEKSNISFSIAATRQTNLLSSVLSNFSDSMSMAEEATSANGNALENNQKWVDSFSGHLQSLENTAKSAWINILDSETIKGGVDVLNSLLKVVVGLVDTFGLLPTAAGIGGIVAGFKNKDIFKTIQSSVDNSKNALGLFGKDFNTYKSNWTNATGGFGGKISTLFNSNDVNCLKEYNAQLQAGINPLQAYKSTMIGCTEEARKNAVAIARGSMTFEEASSSMGKMTTSAKAALSTLKSVAANMAVMIAISLAIKGAIALWDKYNVTVAETQEKIDGINSSLQTLNSEYNELNSRDIDTLSDSEKARLEYLKKRIDAENRLLEIEKKKQAQEAIGTKITDAFDKDNLNNQYAKVVDDYFRYDGQINSALKKYQENLAKFEETGESKYKDKADKYETDIDHKIVILQENYEKLLSIKETLQSYIDEGLLSGDDLTKAQTLITNINGSLSQHKLIINDVDKTISKTIDKADALAERLKNVSSEDIQKNFSEEEIIALGEINFDENATIEDLKKALEEAQKEADENPVEGKLSFADSIKNINEKLAPLSKLEGIFNDVANGDSFDLSKLFDKDFVSIFGEYEDAYNSFVKTVSSSPDDIDKCKSAFNELIAEYINGSDILNDLSGENATAVINLLKDYGIKNAEELVQQYQDSVRTYRKILNEYEKHVNAKGEVNSEYYQNLAKQNPKLVKGLSETYKTDYDNWIELLSKKTEAYNKFIKALNKSQSFNSVQSNSYQNQLSSDIVSIFNGVNVSGLSPEMAMAKRETALKNAGYSMADYTAASARQEANKINKAAQEAKDLLSFNLSEISVDFSPLNTGSGSSGSSSGGSGSGSSKDSKTSIDWIDRKLTVLQNKIDSTKAKFENLFTLKGKKNNLSTQITQTEALLKVTEKAADRYLKKANKVGLSKSLKKKVQNGSYNINEYSSETAEKIQKYQEYWDQYQSQLQKAEELKAQKRNLKIQKQQLISDNAQAKIDRSNAKMALDEGNYKKQNVHLEAQKKYLKEKYDTEIEIAKVNKDTVEQKKLEAEYQKEINDLTKQEFDNIVATYENKQKINADKVSLIQAGLGIAEAKGDIVGSRYYTKQMSLNKTQMQNYTNEMNELISSLNSFKPYSQNWYGAKDQILQVQLAIKNLEEENVNLQNSINQLKFDRFDDLLNKLSDITGESDFLISLLDSDNLFEDNGNITDDGLTAMGLSAMNYDTYMAQADKYKGMIAEVEDMYAQGLIGYEEYVSKMREYQQGQRQSIQSANESKKAVIDYVKQGLDAQNEALSEAIDKQKELLNSEKDLYEFQKKINDQNKNIADLKKQIASLEGDDSEENRKKLQQLKSKLADAEEDQKDTLYDRSISDQEEALDTMLKNSQNATTDYLKDSEKVFIDAIGYVNAHTSQVANNLESISKEVGYDISEYISNAWEGAGNAVDTYQNILQGNVPLITAQIQLITDAWNAATEAAEKAAKATVKDTTDSYKYYDEAAPKVATFITKHLDKSKKPDSLGALNKKLSEWTGGYILSPEEQIELAELLGVEGIHTNVDKFTQEDRKKILEVLEKLELTWSKKKHTVSYTPKGFATGGIIDTKDILKRSGEQGFIIANNGEAVLTNPQWKLLREFADGLNNIEIQAPKIPDIQPRNMQSPVYHIDNSVTVDGVATDQIVKDMEKVAQKQAENTIAKINSLTYSKGVRYK